MLQRMEAEILFLDPDDVAPGSATLIEHGFDVEVLDWIDDYRPTVFIRAKITSELDQDHFFDWVLNLVWSIRGDVVEAGLSDRARQYLDARFGPRNN